MAAWEGFYQELDTPLQVGVGYSLSFDLAFDSLTSYCLIPGPATVGIYLSKRYPGNTTDLYGCHGTNYPKAPVATVVPTPGWSRVTIMFRADSAYNYIILKSIAQGYALVDYFSDLIPNISVSNSPVSCTGMANGKAIAKGNFGTPPYTYRWNTVPAQNTDTATGLAPGTYTVYVTDALLLTDSAWVTITEPAPMVIDSLSTTNSHCTKSPSGTATVWASGGIPPLSYSLDGINFQPAGQFNNLAAGIYTVYVQDSVGCVLDTTLTINGGESPNADFNILEGCPDLIMNFTENVLPGSPDDSIIAFQWDFGDNTTGSGKTVGHAFPAAGTYNIRLIVTSKSGCVDTLIRSVDLPSPPDVFIFPDTTLCFLDSLQPIYCGTGDTYRWYSTTGTTTFDNPDADTTNIFVPYSDTLYVNIKNAECLDTTLFTIITVERPTAPLQTTDSLAACLGDKVEFTATAGEKDYIFWVTPSGDTIPEVSFVIDSATTGQSGTYTAYATLDTAYCNFDTACTYLKVHPLPQIHLTTTQNKYCPDQQFTVQASGAQVYQWFQDGVFLDSVKGNLYTNFSEKGLQIATEGEDMNACINRDTIQVDILPPFHPDLGPDKVRCTGENVGLVLNSEDFYDNPSEVIWSTGADSESIVVTQTDRYWVSVTIDGCTNTDTVQITFQNPETFSLGDDTVLCKGESLTIDLSAYNGTITWDDGSSDPIRTIGYPGGKYYVNIASGACELTDTIAVAFREQHHVSIPADSTICEGTVVTYNGAQGTNLWTINGQDTATQNLSLSRFGDYHITLTNTRGACTAIAQGYLSIVASPSGTLPDQVIICETDSALLDASIIGAQSYLWRSGETLPVQWVKQPGLHPVEITFGSCIIRDTALLITHAMPMPDLGGNHSICEDQNLTLSNNVVDADSVLWNTGHTSHSITVNQPGTSRIDVFRGQCSATDQMALSVDAMPIFDLGNDTGICPQQTLLLSTGYPLLPHTWSDGSTNSFLSVSTQGPYAVTVQKGQCRFSDQINVQFINVPVVNLGPDLQLCDGDMVTLDPNISGQDSILWNTGYTTPGISPDTSGTYIATAYFSQCSVSDTIQLHFFTVPDFALGDDIDTCRGAVVTIGNNLPYTHTWSDGDNGYYKQPSQSDIYTLTLSNGPCTVTDDIRVSFQTPPVVNLGDGLSLCRGDTAIISAPEGMESYYWNDIEGLQHKKITTAGRYILKVVHDACVVSDTLVVTFTTPTPPGFPAIANLCEGESLTLDATVPNGTYLWHDGTTQPAKTISETGHYAVEIQQGPCTIHEQTEILVAQVLPFDLGNDTTVCEDQTVVITTGLSGFITRWSNGSGENTLWVKKQGVYWADVIQGPCIVSDTISIKHNPMPKQPDHYYTACPDGTVEISLNMPDASFRWSTGDTSHAIIAQVDSSYSVQVSNPFGCTANFPFYVNIDPNCPDELYVPNAFTPNNDGINDRFQPQYGQTTLISLAVTNRWGTVVFSTANPQDYWDGTLHGKPVQNGLYIWQLRFINRYGINQIRHGHVMVVR